jgi:DNA repair exonuclease SbcCD ATPase subunit
MNLILSDIKNQIQSLNNDLHIKLGKREALVSRLKICENRLAEIDAETTKLTKASLFLQTLSDTTRQQIIDKISAIVTDALQKVKDTNLEFKMILSTERNQIDVKFVVVDKLTRQEYDILDSCGGTIADIVTFPLRIALLVKWDPVLSKVLIMDENFKFVSVADQEPLADFIRQISEKLNLQILLVTHSQVLSNKAHKIFGVIKNDGVSIVEEKPS